MILGYNDNLQNSAYTDPNGSHKELHWFDVCVPVFAVVAMYCIVTINKSKDGA